MLRCNRKHLRIGSIQSVFYDSVGNTQCAINGRLEIPIVDNDEPLAKFASDLHATALYDSSSRVTGVLQADSERMNLKTVPAEREIRSMTEVFPESFGYRVSFGDD